MQWFLAAFMIACFFTSVLVYARKRGRDRFSPRGLRRTQRRSFYYFLLASCAFVPLFVSQHQWFFALCWIIAIASSAYGAFRKPTAQEFEKNFATDRNRCGQCEYDLTGNVSGTCPECGWIIPASDRIFEDPTWAMWWKGWEISYLENWRKTLTATLLYTLSFLLLAVYLAWQARSFAWSVLPVFMAVQFGINSVRVLRYGKARDEHRPG